MLQERYRYNPLLTRKRNIPDPLALADRPPSPQRSLDTLLDSHNVDRVILWVVKLESKSRQNAAQLMEGYLALCDTGQPFLAIRYEDIQAHPKQVLAAAFAYCGLEADVDRAYDVFASDSQEGTLWSRASREERVNIPLEPEERAWQQAILRERRVVRSADYIAPYTAKFEDES